MVKFNEKEISIADREGALLEVRNVCSQCYTCELGKTRNNIVFSDGFGKIMLIGEAPGADEDATGIPFVGKAGKFLTELITDAGLSRENDFYICNTVKCRPPENRVPTDEEKNACKQFLMAQIAIVNPIFIVLCGSTAAKSFLGEDIKISKIRGNKYTLFGKIPATVIFHPSYLLRNRSEEVNSPIYLTRRDLEAIKNYVQKIRQEQKD